jgi:hypothetical protein
LWAIFATSKQFLEIEQKQSKALQNNLSNEGSTKLQTNRNIPGLVSSFAKITYQFGKIVNTVHLSLIKMRYEMINGD